MNSYREHLLCTVPGLVSKKLCGNASDSLLAQSLNSVIRIAVHECLDLATVEYMQSKLSTPSSLLPSTVKPSFKDETLYVLYDDDDLSGDDWRYR